MLNQQREVVYSLRTFALEGGEELKAEAAKMVEKAVVRRIEMALAEAEHAGGCDLALLRQELLSATCCGAGVRGGATRPPGGIRSGRGRGWAAPGGFASSRVTRLGEGRRQLRARSSMLVVLDEKWKDHLYDLDQLRNSIKYRAWGQKDPLVEYKEEAYTMFVDLMHDVYTTFAERFLRAQVVFEAPAGAMRPGAGSGPARSRPGRATARRARPARPLGTTTRWASSTMAPPPWPPEESAARTVAARAEPMVVGAGGGGRARPLTQPQRGPAGGGGGAPTASAGQNWSTVGRNDPCPCGSGKKFKKCHGATA